MRERVQDVALARFRRLSPGAAQDPRLERASNPQCATAALHERVEESEVEIADFAALAPVGIARRRMAVLVDETIAAAHGNLQQPRPLVLPRVLAGQHLIRADP